MTHRQATSLKIKGLLLIFSFLFIAQGNSQVVRINFMTGLANYNGELQAKRITANQSNAVFGIGASLDVTSKISLRTEYSFTKLGADDKNGKYFTRNLNFKTNIHEGNLLLEYNLWDLEERKFTPYGFAGVGVYSFNPYTFNSINRKVFLVGLGTEGQGLPEYPDRKIYKTTQLNIPMGGGIKYAVSDDVHIGFEYGLRVLFTDYLDDVSTTYADENILLNRRGPLAVALAYRGDEIKINPKPYPNAGSQRGSAKANDQYYYALLRLSIRMNWFDTGLGLSRRNGVACPGRVL